MGDRERGAGTGLSAALGPVQATAIPSFAALAHLWQQLATDAAAAAAACTLRSNLRPFVQLIDAAHSVVIRVFVPCTAARPIITDVVAAQSADLSTE